MKNVAKLIVMTGLFASSAAMAGNAHQFVGSFDDIRGACQNPKQFHNQIAPTNLQVTCKDVQTRWTIDESTLHALDTSRQVTVQVNSDKYTSASETAMVASEAQAVGCPAYKEVIQTVETVRAVTCDELLAFQGTATDFCLDAVSALVDQNPEAINVQATGKVFNMCPSVEAPTQKQAQQSVLQSSSSSSSSSQSSPAQMMQKQKKHHRGFGRIFN
jgi:hypothetical protein